mgnify:CR=1 FL=1
MIYLLLLLAISCSTPKPEGPSMRLTLHNFPNRSSGEVKLQAFSGLFYEGTNKSGELIFWTHSDRGPNADAIGKQRPFLWPDFVPTITQFKLNISTGEIVYLKETALTMPDGKNISGLPNSTKDETPITMNSEVLPYNTMGMDAEAICLVDNHLWLADEYGPSLFKFNLDGVLVKRFVPTGHISRKHELVRETFSTDLMTRELNRGFEGMTCTNDKIYLALQSPLPHEKQNVRIIEFDIKSESVKRTLLYPLDSMDTDKIGDLAVYQGELLVLEQNKSIHNVYAVDFANSKKNEPMKKRLFVDLVKEGFDFAEKIEGITIVENKYLAVLNDNDFGLTGNINSDKTPEIDPKKISVLGMIKL